MPYVVLGDSFIKSAENVFVAVLSTWKYKIIVSAKNSPLIDWRMLGFFQRFVTR